MPRIYEREKIMTRREEREIVFSLLFEKDFQPDRGNEDILFAELENREIEKSDYISNTFLGICDHTAELDEIINRHATGWKTNRLSRVSRCVIRLCAYEMIFADIPASIAINEALEIVKKYGEDNARKFVNGVLNSLKEEKLNENANGEKKDDAE